MRKERVTMRLEEVTKGLCPKCLGWSCPLVCIIIQFSLNMYNCDNEEDGEGYEVMRGGEEVVSKMPRLELPVGMYNYLIFI